MENLGILYYESMIELEIENQRINEAIMTPKFARYFTESDEDVSVYEAKVVSSVLGFIKGIFDKVIKFFQDMIAFITKKDKDNSFNPNPKLIAACEQKIKSITEKEKKEFKEEKMLFSDKINETVDYIEDMTINVAKQLNKIMQYFDTAAEREIADLDALKELKDSSADFGEQLKDRSNIENIKKHATDVSYKDIADILDFYKNSNTSLNDFKQIIEKLTNQMNEYRKKIDQLMNSTTSEEKAKQNLSEYKSAIYSSTAFITNAMRSMLNLHVYDLRYMEIILKKFVAYKISESYTNFDGESVVEQLEYENYERGMILCLN